MGDRYMEFEKKVVIVTGAASGIGLALSRRFQEEGAECVIMCDINETAISWAAGITGGIPFVCDVTDADQVAELVRETENRFGRVDLYCANAGILERGGVETPDRVWRRSLDINMMAHVYAARACLPGMIKQGRGYFLNTVSAAGLLTQIGAVTYSVSKHAAMGFAEWLALTHGHQGIGVTVLCPQAVDTPMINDLEEGGVAGLDGVVTPDTVADCAVAAVRDEQFLALPHPSVLKYFRNKAADYHRWLAGMQRLREQYPQG